MIAEAFENAWIENCGNQPVDDDVLVDVVIDGSETLGDPAGTWLWDTNEEYPITHWRIHHPVDTTLPTPKKCPPMPPCNPPKQEASKVLVAFNRMTGHSLTEDNMETLRILMDVFDRK